MIEINHYDELSRLLFLGDLYEMVLGVEGRILHIGSDCKTDSELWIMLRAIYESLDSRNVCLWDSGPLADRLNEFQEMTPAPIALIYFDGRSDPGVIQGVLDAVVPFLTRGSVLAFNCPAAAVGAINEVMGLNNLAMQRWHHSRRDCYAIV